jgi:hypothetical protein
MSWLYSQALVEEYLGENSLDGAQSAPLNGSRTQQAYCVPDKMTDFSRLSRFGMMYKPLTETRGEELLTLYLAAFHARTLVPQEKAQALTARGLECGERWHGLLARFDPNSHLWRTVQCSLVEDLNESFQTLPQWGMTVGGELYLLPTLVQTTNENESGLWRTPDTGAGGTSGLLKQGQSKRANGQPIQIRLVDQVNNPHLWPTPNARDWKDSQTSGNRKSPGLGVVAHIWKAIAGGSLNPLWVEWLMGWPLGWTDLKPLAMGKSHCVQQQHGEF